MPVVFLWIEKNEVCNNQQYKKLNESNKVIDLNLNNDDGIYVIQLDIVPIKHWTNKQN